MQGAVGSGDEEATIHSLIRELAKRGERKEIGFRQWAIWTKWTDWTDILEENYGG